MAFADPLAISATLYMQGRMDEAETLCKIVLSVKPWHFGALSGIVMIYAGSRDSQVLVCGRHTAFLRRRYESSPCGLGQHAVREARNLRG
jgi:hypothetical protein